MKTAIVVGATGLIGKSLIKQLDADPHFSHVIAITRKPVHYNSERITNHVVNFKKLAQYHHCFSGDVLFSCLGTTKKQAGSIQAQRVVDVEYQYQAAVLACKNNVKHYVLVSSSGANSGAKSSYFKMKGELENKIEMLNFARTSILRPSLLLGDREDIRLAEKLASYILPILCKLPLFRHYRPIEGALVAQKMIDVIAHQTENMKVYSPDTLFNQH